MAVAVLGACNTTKTGPTGNDEGSPLESSTSGDDTTTDTPTTNSTSSSTSEPNDTSGGASTTEGGDTSGSSSGAATTEGSTTSSDESSTGGVAVCDPHRADDECWACTRETCCDELETCYADPDCTCYADCVSAGTEPVTCFTETCMLMMMPAGLADLQNCQYQDCADPCPP